MQIYAPRKKREDSREPGKRQLVINLAASCIINPITPRLHQNSITCITNYHMGSKVIFFSLETQLFNVFETISTLFGNGTLRKKSVFNEETT